MAISARGRLRQISRSGFLSAEERVRLILDDRTERLAGRADRREAAVSETVQVLVCGAGRESYGIPLRAVAQVLPFRACLPVPDGPAALVGLFGRDGQLVSVIDLGAAVGLGPPGENGSQHLVLLRQMPLPVALRVDRAHGVAAVVPIGAEEAGGSRHEAVTAYARVQSGIVEQERVLSLLDVGRLLRPYLPSLPASGA